MASPENPNMKRKRQKSCPRSAVQRWRSPTNGTVVVLTAAGELWQREKAAWRRRAGVWTAKKVEDWAAATGFVRACTGTIQGGPERAWVTKIARGPLDWLAKGRAMPDVLTSARMTRRTKGSRAERTRAAGPVVSPGESPGCPAALSLRMAEELGVPLSYLTSSELAGRLDLYAERAARNHPLFD